MRNKFLFPAIACLFLAAACSSGGGGDDDSIESTSDSEIASRIAFTTDCGTVVSNGEEEDFFSELQNPVDSSLGELVEIVQVVDSNLLIVRKPLGDVLVKLHGISPTGARTESAVALLQSLSAGGAYLFEAVPSCIVSVVQGGGLAVTGQLFTLDGKSFSEELLRSGFAGEIETGGACQESLIIPCYQSLRDAHTQKSAGDITDFLWKPRAESEYNAGNPVIHANPCNATVHVNGNPLLDFGPANGRCNTSRMFSSCGSFGSNIKVEIFDNETGLPYFNGDDPFVIVPNGCSRYEFKR